MSLKNTPSPTQGQYAGDLAQLAVAKLLVNDTSTLLTSESLERDYWLNRKDTLPPEIVLSLTRSEINIPGSTFASSLPQTTGAPSSTSKDIPSGRKSMDSNGALETSSQPSGSTEVFIPPIPNPEPTGITYTGYPAATKAETYDTGKAPLAQLPWAAVDAMSKVQLYGHKKYKDFNNFRKGMEVSRNLSCALRHIKEYMEGHDVDYESGESPLAHAMCRVAFVLQNIHDGTAIDDRYKSHAN